MLLFPKKEIEIKSKYLNTAWITKRVRKSYKRKKHLIVDRIKKNDAKSIAERFDAIFVDIGPNIPKKVSNVILLLNHVF